MRRCEWAKNELYIAYHDHEWGVPVHNDRDLFEFLILEGISGVELGDHSQEAGQLPRRPG